MIESSGEKNGKGGGYVLPCMPLVQGEMDYYLPCMALVHGRDGLLLAMHGVGAGGDGLLLASGPSPHPIVCGIISYLCL